DCGIRSGDIADENLIARSLGNAGMLVAASPAYLARHGSPGAPQDLEKHVLLGFSTWGRDHVLRFTRAGDTVDVPLRAPLVITNGQALLNAARAGSGVVVQPDVLLDPAVAAGELVRLLADWSLPSRPMHIVRLPDARPSAKLRTFVDFVIEQLATPTSARG